MGGGTGAIWAVHLTRNLAEELIDGHTHKYFQLYMNQSVSLES